ncbi:MAG: RNA polymerase sigma factor [Planctomycetota bacterium]|nr:RNA polymerase sigma factor [Planctomycetota bacterium]
MESFSSDAKGFHDLVRRAQNGDRKAMDEVISILRPYLERLARPFADPARPAESTGDLLQESCLRIWQKLESFEGGMNDDETFAMFRSWIGQIVKRLGLNSQRDHGRQRRSPPGKILKIGQAQPSGPSTSGSKLEPPSPGPSPSTYARVDERAEKIQEVLDALPDQTDATIVRMRFFEGESLVSIAKKLSIGYEQVKERYRRTMRQLENDLDGLL